MQLKGLSLFSCIFLLVATSSAGFAFAGRGIASAPLQAVMASVSAAASEAVQTQASDEAFAQIEALLSQKKYAEVSARFQVLIENGSAKAMTLYGRLLIQGMEGNERAQHAKGLTYLEKAAEKDYLPALDLLAKIYSAGYGTIRKNVLKAEVAMAALADLGSLPAQLDLAEKWKDGSFGRIDGDLSLRYLEMAALQGHAPAYYPLLEAYSIGTLSTSPNSKKAAIWGKKIVAVGGVEDIARVGVYFLKHHDNAENARQGLRYLEQAAEKEYQPAYSALAGLYWNGARGIDPNPLTALRWIEQSANAGDVDSFKMLINHHTHEENYRQAREFGDRMVKDARSPMDFNWLIKFFIARDVPQNVVYFVKRAASFEDPQALFYVATLLYEGVKSSYTSKPMKKAMIEAQGRFLAAKMQCRIGTGPNICHFFQDIRTRAIFDAWEERDKGVEREKARAVASLQQTRDIAAARKDISSYRGNYLSQCSSAPSLPSLRASRSATKSADREADAWFECVNQAIRDAYKLRDAENLAVIYSNEDAYHAYVPVSQQRGTRDASRGLEAFASFDRAIADRNVRVDREEAADRRYVARKRRSAENGAQLRRRNAQRNQSYRRLQRSLQDLGRQACETSNAGWRSKGSAYWGMIQNCSR